MSYIFGVVIGNVSLIESLTWIILELTLKSDQHYLNIVY